MTLAHGRTGVQGLLPSDLVHRVLALSPSLAQCTTNDGSLEHGLMASVNTEWREGIRGIKLGRAKAALYERVSGGSACEVAGCRTLNVR